MRPTRSFRSFLLAGIFAAGMKSPVPAQTFRYEFTLADFSGPLPLLGARVRLDVPRNEAYVQQGNMVRIFGPSGMETYSFVIDPALGQFADLAIDESGDIHLLGFRPGSADGTGFFILRCDYRGRPVAEIVPSGVPSELQDLAPETLILSGGRYFLASSSRMAVVVLDRSGAVVATADLAELAEIEPARRAEMMYGGFTVDRDGRLVFSLPTDFSVRVASLDGTRKRRIGEAGGKPGQFGIAGAVETDADANLYVADRLRHVVMMFDAEGRFITEFGRLGEGERNLVIPTGLAVSPDRLFVSQMKNRGVTVFARGAGDAEDDPPPNSLLRMPGSR